MSIANKLLEEYSSEYSPSSPVNSPNKISSLEELLAIHESFMNTLKLGLRIHASRGDSIAWDPNSEKELYNAVKDLAGLIHIHAQDPNNWDQSLFDDMTVYAIEACKTAEQKYKSNNTF